MFCSKCERILDLDTLVGTMWWRKGGYPRPFPHHESFAALVRSAAEGCDLCKLVLKPLERQQISHIDLLQGEDVELFFKLGFSDCL